MDISQKKSKDTQCCIVSLAAASGVGGFIGTIGGGYAIGSIFFGITFIIVCFLEYYLIYIRKDKSLEKYRVKQEQKKKLPRRDSKTCPKCGNRVKKGNKYCYGCGNQI